MKHISKLFQSNRSAFPKTQDQKNLERQKGEMESFMMSFSTHEFIVETIQKSLLEVYKARNISGILIRDLSIDDYFRLKDGWTGSFAERIDLLELELSSICDGTDRDRVCRRVSELLSAALVAASQGGTFDDEDRYGGWKPGMSQTDGPRRGSSGSVLTTPSRILDSVDHEDDDRTIS